jgi:trehalose-phosphatase
MRILKPGVEPQGFFARVRAAERRVLMLDYDGTLAPFRAERDQAVPYPGVCERIAALMERGRTRVVLISGRVAREVAALAGLAPAPEVWGTHGWERLAPDGAYALAPLPAAAAAGLREAEAAVHARSHPGWAGRLERKPASVAFHTRGLEPAERERSLREVRAGWEPLAARQGLEVHPFDGGIELRVPGHSKGTAVRLLLEEAGPQAVCAYLGDDLTDEDAFLAIAQRGLGVLVREQPRETAAAWWLQPPAELLDFFDQWLQASREDS